MRPSKFKSVLVVLVVSAASGLFTQAVHSQPPEKGSWQANTVVRDPQIVSDPFIGRWIQGVSLYQDHIYIYGDIAGRQPDTGAVVEYTLALKPTGRKIILTENGVSVMPHPTALTWDDKWGTFMANIYTKVETIFHIDWPRALRDGNLDHAILHRTLDGQGWGTHPEFVTVGGRRLLATADYGTESPEIRLYDPELLLQAKSTSDPGVTVHRISAGTFNQNVTWNEPMGQLICVQNIEHGTGWRLDVIDLAKAILAGTVNESGVRVNTMTFMPHTEVEGFRYLPDGRGLFAVATGNPQNVFVGRIEQVPPFTSPPGNRELSP
tara:strand:- start:260 stop:1225 length:966 start_codon:yes stop_codon:yes gene_type:complete